MEYRYNIIQPSPDLYRGEAPLDFMIFLQKYLQKKKPQQAQCLPLLLCDSGCSVYVL